MELIEVPQFTEAYLRHGEYKDAPSLTLCNACSSLLTFDPARVGVVSQVMQTSFCDLQTSRQQICGLLTHQAILLELFDVPQLTETCVASGGHIEALDLTLVLLITEPPGSFCYGKIIQDRFAIFRYFCHKILTQTVQYVACLRYPLLQSLQSPPLHFAIFL